MITNHFDYAIIGAGAAGFQLSVKMAEDPFFEQKNILVIEKLDKVKNDRTWSFWEKGKGRWDDFLLHSWNKGEFHTNKISKALHLNNYRYKTIRSSNFYTAAKEIIQKKSNFYWVKGEVEQVNFSTTTPPLIKVNQDSYSADHIFDSRIDPDFFEENDSIKLLQHFKGWFIKTQEPVFDPESFVMMDFRLQWKDHTSFTYVLPFSAHEAMIEFTLFDQKVIKDEDYNEKLKQYISDFLKIDNYEILEEEKGVIPMSNYPFYKKNNQQLTKIGTAGGWVKPSSGYAFKNCGKYSQKIINNIKAGKTPSYQLFRKQYQWYDGLLLDILWNRNELGIKIFEEMFNNNSIEKIFKFLDDEGTLISDISIIKSFSPSPFLKALGKKLKMKLT